MKNVKKKYIAIFCIMLFFISLSNISYAQKTIKDENKKFVLEITPINKEITTLDVESNPNVVITYPEDGSKVSDPYIEVLGYAYDPDGLDYMEWTYEHGSYYYYDNETLDVAPYYGFRIRVFDINPGTHTVTVTYYDIYDNFGTDSVTVYYSENNPPEIPKKPTGPETGKIGMQYTFSTQSTDSDDDEIRYGWDFGNDDVIDTWTDFYPSGETVEASYIWNQEGIYSVKVKAQDSKGEDSVFSSSLNIQITGNSPPNKPSTPQGSPNGAPGVSYSYKSSTIDPEGHRLYYLFDWADGTDSGWVGPYDSGDEITISHIWDKKGSFNIKVKAKDDPNADGDLSDGLESVWSDSLEISMPRSRSINIFESIFAKMPRLRTFFILFFIQNT